RVHRFRGGARQRAGASGLPTARAAARGRKLRVRSVVRARRPRHPRLPVLGTELMAEQDVELVRHGFEAWARGDVAALTALLDPDVYWRGIERGRLWWRRAPT